MGIKSKKHTKRGGGTSGHEHLAKMGLGSIEGQSSKFTQSGSLVGGSRKRKYKGKKRRGGFAKHVVPLALLGMQQHAKKKNGKLAVVRATRKVGRVGKNGLSMVGKTLKRIGSRIKKTFSRKKR
tara:strand:- start:41 stop:412 length:372 start_codon:yes stop_codon:yes gene_type:complete